MQQRIKNLLEHNSLFLALFCTLLILALSMMNMNGVPTIKYNHIDKFEHAFAYAVMSFFWFVSYQVGKIKIKFLNLVLIIIAYGVLIEIMQWKLTTSRTGDLLDVMANTIGVVLGCVIFKILRRLYLQV